MGSSSRRSRDWAGTSIDSSGAGGQLDSRRNRASCRDLKVVVRVKIRAARGRAPAAICDTLQAGKSSQAASHQSHENPGDRPLSGVWLGRSLSQGLQAFLSGGARRIPANCGAWAAPDSRLASQQLMYAGYESNRRMPITLDQGSARDDTI